MTRKSRGGVPIEDLFQEGFEQGAADMRERIAAYLEAEADKLTAEFVDHNTAKCRAESYRIAARNIRARPLSELQQEAGDGHE